MKIILHDDELKVVDAKNKLIVLSRPLNTLADIFSTYWVKTTGTKITNGLAIINDDNWPIRSFKDLKHRVAAYSIMNNTGAKIPDAYRKAFERNGHNYDQTKKDGSMQS